MQHAHASESAHDEHLKSHPCGPHVDESLALIARREGLARRAHGDNEVQQDLEYDEGGDEGHRQRVNRTGRHASCKHPDDVPEKDAEEEQDGDERDPRALLSKGHFRPQFHVKYS